MDIKPVHPTTPPAPLHKVKEEEARRREQDAKHQTGDPHSDRPEQADHGPHVDAYG